MPINITDVAQCFQNCTSLTNIPDNFELPPNVIYMQYMFANTSINTPNKFILPSTTLNIIHLFDGCKNLISTPPHMFDNNPIIDSYDYLFNNCTSLTNIDETFKYLNTVKSSAYTFNNCKLTEIPQTIILPNELLNIEYCFNNNTTLTTIHSNFKFPTSLINLRYCFNNCTSLLSIPETIWPEQYETDQIYVSNVCNNCISLHANIPAEKLWENLNIQWNSVKAFANCNNIINYNGIPSTWK